MNKLSLFILAFALLCGAFAPTVDTTLANKAGGAKTRLPHSLKQDKKQQDEKSTAPEIACLA